MRSSVVVVVVAVVVLPLAQARTVTKCETAAYPPDPRDEVPLYQVDLDLPPRDRWTLLAKDKGPQMQALADEVTQLMYTVLGERIYQIIFRGISEVASSLPEPYKEEIEGIASASGMPVTTVTMYNIFYELSTFCTSLVVQDLSGRLYHARNLDIAFLGWETRNHTWKVAELLKSVTVRLQWTKGGVTVFESLSFSGQIGVFTAVKKDSFTFSLNKRFTLTGGIFGLLEWILLKDHNQRWVSFLTRDVMETATTYKDARDALSHYRLLAPVYFILAGTQPSQACVITRDRNNYDLESLGKDKRWFLVQTNYDHWKSPPILDDRRTPSQQCLAAAGVHQASPALLYNVLSTRPVLNKATVYTALMDVRLGEVNGWVRDCPDPCWPW